MVEASLDGWLTSGRFNEEFEKASKFYRHKTSYHGEFWFISKFSAFNVLTSSKLQDRAIKKGDEVLVLLQGSLQQSIHCSVWSSASIR